MRRRVALIGKIAAGQTQVVIGTHALVQEHTVFKKLGLVIVDEQHRFGVVQLGYVRRMLERRHHEMAVRVGKSIEHDEGVIAAV